MARYHISGFVAYETIDPGELWQREIEAALRSMHAMAALITPDFHDSKWTDQEVGWALGSGVPPENPVHLIVHRLALGV